MRAKEYLGQFGRYEDKILRKLSEVYKSRVLAENATVAFGNERVQTSGDGDRIGSLVAVIMDAEREAERMIKDYGDFRTEALVFLEGMCLLGNAGMEQYKVLHLRFVERKTFEDIAECLACSERHVYSVYKDGLAQFERLYLS